VDHADADGELGRALVPAVAVNVGMVMGRRVEPAARYVIAIGIDTIADRIIVMETVDRCVGVGVLDGVNRPEAEAEPAKDPPELDDEEQPSAPHPELTAFTDE
jgi:hypothetical protein